ncbi:MAG: PAS domain-containing protein, partial [Pirellula sp.]|nr:PAS domain-containing protein [Pirellula sp.]
MTSTVCRILIIDADVENRADLRQLILNGSDRPYEFEEADLGAKALQQLRDVSNAPFDCILLAYCLPDFDAREMLAALCDGQELPPCPVVVLTSSDRQIGKELMRNGAQDYLGKGWITPESLTRAIDNAMEHFTLLIDRREKELALRESESRLALGVEVAGLALAEVDYITGYVHLTVDAAKLFGLPQDALVVPRETVHAAFHPDDHDELMIRIDESLLPSGRGWFAMDHRVLWPNGEVHWLRVRKQVYFEGEKKDRHPVNAMLAVFDVTAEKNAAEIVRASGEFVRAVLDSLPDHVVVLDDLGTVLAVNQPSDRHTLESSATLSTAAVGVNYIDLCREAIAKGGPDVHVMVDGLEEVLNRTRDDFKTEYPCLAPGREEWFSMHAQRMKSENAGVILIHVNITDSRIAQMKLEESETRFRRLFEAAHDGILILDASTQKITHVNPFLTKLLDYTAEHFLGKE